MNNESAELVLTGQLPFIVLLGAALALPLSLLLLRRYTRAFVRAMKTNASGQPVARVSAETKQVGTPSGRLETVWIDATSPASAGSPPSESGTDARAFTRRGAYDRAMRMPWVTACVYAGGGLAYALTMAAAQLVADQGFSLLRFIALAAIYAWPIAIAINLVVPSTARVKRLSFGGYFAILIALFVVAATVSPSVSVAELLVAWGLFSLPPTVLLLFFMHRRVRAVGPMVLTFAIISLTGANVAVAIVGSSDSVLRAFAAAAVAIGSNAIGALISIVLLGFAIFAVVGWYANQWIRKRYISKFLNDQSLTLDAMWLLFATIQSIGLAFVSPAWFAAGLVAFVVYKLTVSLGFRVIGGTPDNGGEIPIKLLFLRVFSLGRRSEKVFAALSTHWRYLGPVRMIAGPDLAAATVEPHEFLEYLGGKLDGAFIVDAAALDRRIADLDVQADFDGRYRVNDFFCYDDTWRMVLSRLVAESNAVFMDVRGFTARNAGVVFELNELIDTVPLHRVVLAYDRTTDTTFLKEVLDQAWSEMRSDSPNRGGGAVLTLCEVAPGGGSSVSKVLRMLCQSAAAA